MAGVPVAARYFVRHKEDFFHRYQCVHCGFQIPVVATGFGRGYGLSVLFLDNEGAVGRAEMRALQNAADDAKQNVRLWPCPKCGKRDSAAFHRKSALLVGGLALGLFALGVVMFQGADPGAAWSVWSAGVILPIIVYYAAVWPKLKGAETAVITQEEYNAAHGLPDTDDNESEAPKSPKHPPPAHERAPTGRGERYALAYLENRSSGTKTSPLTLILAVIVVAAIFAALAR